MFLCISLVIGNGDKGVVAFSIHFFFPSSQSLGFEFERARQKKVNRTRSTFYYSYRSTRANNDKRARAGVRLRLRERERGQKQKRRISALITHIYIYTLCASHGIARVSERDIFDFRRRGAGEETNIKQHVDF